MYIIFKNDKEVLRYYTEVLPDVFKDDKVVEVDSIPEKDGYIAKAKLVNDEIQWTYEKESKTMIEEIQDENQALRKSSQMSLRTIMELDQKVISLEKKLNEITK